MFYERTGETLSETRPARESDVSRSASLDALMTIFHEVPLVLSLRIPKLMDETTIFSPFDRDETRRAITEKPGAFVEGIAAAHMAAFAACLTLQAETLSGPLTPWRLFEAMDTIVAASLAPSVERLQANDDRLSSDG
ncbi:hypothetical protein E3C22_07005 [Jiella endophytica]|uniref:Uncharacterized protein n=1 Tax=Jiella endophytica TaxID=2558362 RepID=A0A4Y8RN91_9HYPH|nr:hypothetical protein [Jiella endophytica]TFF25123.1 hypothetical protein E3C22_07005 [Jiella endophytica]